MKRATEQAGPLLIQRPRRTPGPPTFSCRQKHQCPVHHDPHAWLQYRQPPPPIKEHAPPIRSSLVLARENARAPRNDLQSGDKNRRERDVREESRRVVRSALPRGTHVQVRYKGDNEKERTRHHDVPNRRRPEQTTTAIPQRTSVEEETDVKQEKTSSTLAV